MTMNTFRFFGKWNLKTTSSPRISIFYGPFGLGPLKLDLQSPLFFLCFPTALPIPYVVNLSNMLVKVLDNIFNFFGTPAARCTFTPFIKKHFGLKVPGLLSPHMLNTFDQFPFWSSLFYVVSRFWDPWGTHGGAYGPSFRRSFFPVRVRPGFLFVQPRLCL